MCIYLYIESPCLSTASPPSLLLMAPNQAAADLTNLFGMACSSAAARAVQSSALMQGGSCTSSTEIWELA